MLTSLQSFVLRAVLPASAAASLVFTAPAGAQTNVVQSGTTTAVLNPALIESAAGLQLTGANSTAAPLLTAPPGFAAAGFSILPSTTFAFTFENGFVPVSGTIEHSGSVTFVTTRGNALPVGTAVTVGNFSIGYDPARASAGPDGRSGFFIRDTFSNLGILFDLSNPGQVTFNSGNLTIGSTNLLVSSEFNSFLNSAGLATSNLAGAAVGFAQTNAFAVPEPRTTAFLAVAALGAGIAWLRRRTPRSA